MKKTNITVAFLLVLGLVCLFSGNVLGANSQKGTANQTGTKPDDMTAEEKAMTEASSFVVDEDQNTITYISPEETNDEDVNVYEKFDDVSEDAWYEGYLSHLVQLGIIDGVSSDEFAPNAYVSRAQFAKMLAYASNADLSQYEGVSSFADVAADAWYAPAVEWSYQQGLIKGRGDGLFWPESYITREEAAVLVDRYATSQGSEIVADNQYELDPDAALYLSADEIKALERLLGDPTYGDQKQISDWAKIDVSDMTVAGIFNGDQDNTFNPQDPLRRSECVKIISAYIINTAKPTFCFPGGSYIEYLDNGQEDTAATTASAVNSPAETMTEFNGYGDAPDLSVLLPEEQSAGGASLSWLPADHQGITSTAFEMLKTDRAYIYDKMCNESFTFSYIDPNGSFVTNYIPGIAALCIYSYYTDAIENQNNYYYSHYYDPDTGASYNSSTVWNASVFFNNHFYNAYTSYLNGNKSNAYREIGMSIHYLEDLNNPYHATNRAEATTPNHHIYETWSSALLAQMSCQIDISTYRFTYDNTFEYMADSFSREAKNRFAVCDNFNYNYTPAKDATLYLLNRSARATAGILNRFYYYGWLNH